MTHNRIVGKLIETEEEMRHELVAGRNIVDAAKVCFLFFLFPFQIDSVWMLVVWMVADSEQECAIPHVIWSSLPNITAASHGRFDKVFHFDHKNLIEQWAREELSAVTVLYPGIAPSTPDLSVYLSIHLSGWCIRF